MFDRRAAVGIDGRLDEWRTRWRRRDRRRLGRVNDRWALSSGFARSSVKQASALFNLVFRVDGLRWLSKNQQDSIYRP